MNGEDLLTIDQLVEQFPAFREKTIRWWIYNGKTNGFEECLIRIGSRIYVDRTKFADWIESHRAIPDYPELDEESEIPTISDD